MTHNAIVLNPNSLALNKTFLKIWKIIKISINFITPQNRPPKSQQLTYNMNAKYSPMLFYIYRYK